ncbi:MAG: hypothetical protein V1773_12490 [bacterium]
MFIHSELDIAECHEHLHANHDFCVLVQDTLPVKQNINVQFNLFNHLIEGTFETIDISLLTNNFYFSPDENKSLLQEDPLYIKHQSFLI